MARILAIVNQKGGVGKTTTAVNLGAALARAGQRTLVVDCDPQSNATRSLGVMGDPRPTLYDVLVSDAVRVEDALVSPGPANLSLLPASPSLAGAEVELVGMPSRERRLATALGPLRSRFDYVLLDCPPSLGLLSVNALVSADGVLVPVQCEYLSLEGVGLLTRTLDLVRAHLNPALELTGVVMTMFDPRTLAPAWQVRS
jgi:chromosome partitioning protein